MMLSIYSSMSFVKLPVLWCRERLQRPPPPTLIIVGERGLAGGMLEMLLALSMASDCIRRLLLLYYSILLLVLTLSYLHYFSLFLQVGYIGTATSVILFKIFIIYFNISFYDVSPISLNPVLNPFLILSSSFHTPPPYPSPSWRWYYWPTSIISPIMPSSIPL